MQNIIRKIVTPIPEKVGKTPRLDLEGGKQIILKRNNHAKSPSEKFLRFCRKGGKTMHAEGNGSSICPRCFALGLFYEPVGWEVDLVCLFCGYREARVEPHSVIETKKPILLHSTGILSGKVVSDA